MEDKETTVGPIRFHTRQGDLLLAPNTQVVAVEAHEEGSVLYAMFGAIALQDGGLTKFTVIDSPEDAHKILHEHRIALNKSMIEWQKKKLEERTKRLNEMRSMRMGTTMIQPVDGLDSAVLVGDEYGALADASLDVPVMGPMTGPMRPTGGW